MKYDDKTVLVSLNDSLLQSLNKRSLNKEDIVVNKIKNMFNDNAIITIDCGSLYLNKQHNITEFLKNNLSVKEIKATQIESIYAARKSYTKLKISKKFINYYKIDQNDQKINISEAIKNSKNVGVLLSCIANDMMNSFGTDPTPYLFNMFTFNKNIIKRTDLLIKYDDFYLELINGLKNNIEQILGLNKNAKICVFGIYRPKMLPKKFLKVIDFINDQIKDLVKLYKQSYIDINNIKSK